MPKFPNILDVQQHNNIEKTRRNKKLVLERRTPVAGQAPKPKGLIPIVKKEVITLFSKGYSYVEITDRLMEMGYSHSAATGIIMRVRKELVKETEKFKEVVVNQNILILQNIIKSCLEDQKYREAISAITELNRCVGAYNPKVEVNVQNYGFDFGMPTQVVEVKDDEIEDIDTEDADY